MPVTGTQTGMPIIGTRAGVPVIGTEAGLPVIGIRAGLPVIGTGQEYHNKFRCTGQSRSWWLKYYVLHAFSVVVSSTLFGNFAFAFAEGLIFLLVNAAVV